MNVTVGSEISPSTGVRVRIVLSWGRRPNSDSVSASQSISESISFSRVS